MTIQQAIQQLDTTAEVVLYEIDLSDIAPDLTGDDRYLRFAPMTNELSQPIVWNGNSYTPYPIYAEGFEINSQQPPRPTLKAANLNGVLTNLCLLYNDLLQAKLTRTTTFAKYLDAVNFRDGNANADPSQHKPLEVFEINQKTEENDIYIQWDLRWSFDIQGVMIPFRVMPQTICGWQYKADGCEWVPVEGSYYDLTDQSCTAEEDECSLLLTGCRLRWGAKAALPFGGAPGAEVVQS